MHGVFAPLIGCVPVLDAELCQVQQS